MVLPRWLARFNRRVTNRLAAAVAGKGRPFSTVVHVGRVSGKTYRTPVTVFADGDRYRIALTYGPGADWVQNVLAAGELWLEHRRTLVHLSSLEVVATERAIEHVPTAVGAALRAIGTEHFLIGRE
jgi:deazaflavin-dependent oxidoreductase (nitroreductase family)